MSSLTKLKMLYAENSKHSNYQILSDKLASLIAVDQLEIKSRYEHERLDYILRNISIDGKNILDIGGNCGFFTFEAIEKGAKKVHYWEGNKTHCDFVELASEVLGCAKKINIINAYYDFKDKGTIGYDVVFLLNVLHHLGDDYGDSELSIDAAKEHMAIQLNSMAAKTKFIIFQLGFCWKGNRDIGLFKNGTKKELISYVTELVKGVWEVRNIGIPVMEAGKIVYVDIDDQNILRNDTLGEFLNRPLFVLEAN